MDVPAAILTYPGKLSSQALENIVRQLDKAFPRQKVIILEEGMKLEFVKTGAFSRVAALAAREMQGMLNADERFELTNRKSDPQPDIRPKADVFRR